MNYEKIYNECVFTSSSVWKQPMNRAVIEKSLVGFFTGVSKNGRRTICQFAKGVSIPNTEVAALEETDLDTLIREAENDLVNSLKDEIINTWKQDKDTLFWKVRSKYRNKEYHFIRLEPIKS